MITELNIYHGMIIIGFILIFISVAYGIYGLIYSIKLERYLKRKNTRRWEEIYSPKNLKTSEKFIYLRAWRYFYDTKDTNDRNILEIKKKIRKGIKYSFIIIPFAFLVFIIVIVYSAVYIY